MKINLLKIILLIFSFIPLLSEEIGRFKEINLDTEFKDIKRKKIYGKDCAKFEGVASISKAVKNAIKIDENIIGMYKVKVTFEEFEFFGNHCIYVEGYPRFKNEKIK